VATGGADRRKLGLATSAPTTWSRATPWPAGSGGTVTGGSVGSVVVVLGGRVVDVVVGIVVVVVAGMVVVVVGMGIVVGVVVGGGGALSLRPSSRSMLAMGGHWSLPHVGVENCRVLAPVLRSDSAIGAIVLRHASPPTVPASGFGSLSVRLTPLILTLNVG